MLRHRHEAVEGVGVAADSDVGGGPVGSCTLLDVDLVGRASASPSDGGGVVVLRYRGDDRLATSGAYTTDKLHDRTGLFITCVAFE